MSSTRRSPVMVAICVVFGAGLGGYIVVSASDTGTELANGATTAVVGRDWGKNRQDRPIIEVGGKRYICSGADTVTTGATVRYDPLDPANCRLAADIGQLNSGQKFRIGAGVIVGLFMIWLGLFGPQRRSGS